MAERAGHATPHRIQTFLGEASWDADALLAEVQDYIAGRLGDAQATLVLDDTQVIKKGTRSVGVAHQECGSTADVRNCQVMVMLTYAAGAGHTCRRLCLPAVWAGDAGRRRDACVPEEITFATKPKLGIEMLRGAIERDLPLLGWPPTPITARTPPGKPYQRAVARAGDLLHYAIVRDQLERNADSLDLSDLIVGTRALHPREAARTLIAAIVDANHGHLQDDATVMCLDWHGVGHSERDADTGADLSDASAPSRTGRTTPGRRLDDCSDTPLRPVSGRAAVGALARLTASPGEAPAATAQA